MKLSIFFLAAMISASASASSITCKAKVMTDEMFNSILSDGNEKPAIENEFSLKLENGKAFLNNVVAKNNVDASFNFAVAVENNKIIAISIEDEMARTSSGLEDLSLDKISFSAGNQELDSSLYLNCEIK